MTFLYILSIVTIIICIRELIVNYIEYKNTKEKRFLFLFLFYLFISILYPLILIFLPTYLQNN